MNEQYKINANKSWNKKDCNSSRTYPVVEHSESIRPAGSFQVSPSLPTLFWENDMQTPVVIRAGEPVAFDRFGHLVPASFLYNQSDVRAVYTQQDIDRGVLNTDGTVPVVGQGYSANQGISFAVGVAPYNYYAHSGGDNLDPTGLDYSNFTPQPRVAFVCDYVLRLPVVSRSFFDLNAGDIPKHLQVLIIPDALGAAPYGKFVTLEITSNHFELIAEPTDTPVGHPVELLGQLLSFDQNIPDDLLWAVRSPTGLSGTGTLGQEQSVHESLQLIGLATINLINR